MDVRFNLWFYRRVQWLKSTYYIFLRTWSEGCFWQVLCSFHVVLFKTSGSLDEARAVSSRGAFLYELFLACRDKKLRSTALLICHQHILQAHAPTLSVAQRVHWVRASRQGDDTCRLYGFHILYYGNIISHVNFGLYECCARASFNVFEVPLANWPGDDYSASSKSKHMLGKVPSDAWHVLVSLMI